jgi:hypothetical protein
MIALLERLWRRRLRQPGADDPSTNQLPVSTESVEDDERESGAIAATSDIETPATAAQDVSVGAMAIEAAQLKRNIRRLEARIAEREHERMQRRETLCYLPSYQGKDFAQALVCGEVERHDLAEAWEWVKARKEASEAEGYHKFYLDLDHDHSCRCYEVDRLYYEPNKGIFIEGSWHPEALKIRRYFKGVSPSWLRWSDKYPPSPRLLSFNEKRTIENYKSMRGRRVDMVQSIGAVCLKDRPTFSETIHTDDPGSKVLEAINQKVIT